MDRREISWTTRAIKEKLQIFDYWYLRNKSPRYSRRLNDIFKITLDLLASQPEIGKVFNKHREIYFIVLKSYRIYYVFNEKQLIVLSVWDTRRNPSKFDI